MKLTLQIKLLPSEEQKTVLLDTIQACNRACQAISDVAWEAKCFNQFKVHHLVYYNIRETTPLSSQATIRCISKVINTYKTDKKKKHRFKLLGGITYDPRLLSYKKGGIISIWVLGGRQKIPFVCHNEKYVPYIQGEADLIYRKGKFYIFQVVEVPEEDIRDVEEFLGVDFGVNNIATLSDETTYSSTELNKIRDKHFRTRKSLQSKGTSGTKKCLKRLQGREARFASITNHTISKAIVSKARSQNKGIAIEDLTGIRTSTKQRKSQRRRHSSWSFYQLRSFIEYKAKLAGIPCIAVNPYMTSQTCSDCGVVGKRKTSLFSCRDCGNILHADINAARNIAQLGASVNCPERATMVDCIDHGSLKPHSLG